MITGNNGFAFIIVVISSLFRFGTVSLIGIVELVVGRHVCINND